jgi:uncharacterized protein (DUF58 family)
MATMVQRYLDPAVLAGISGLDLLAKTVVDGFIAGLHRSPDFGFSQEFAEYRPYTEGDDPRYIDWNVFARTERAYLKRYRGETNTRLTILLDRSASMAFSTHRVNKMEYSRFAAASVAYLAHTQRDAVGVISFDDDVRDYIHPSSRQGQLMRVLHTIERAEPGSRTDYARPFHHFQEFLRRRGLVLVVSDFYAPPEEIIKTIAPLRFRGNDVILFHVLDPQEIKPQINEPKVLIDMETGAELEVGPEYAREEYPARIASHLAALRSHAEGAGLSYCLLPTDQPLDESLRSYLGVRQGRL